MNAVPIMDRVCGTRKGKVMKVYYIVFLDTTNTKIYLFCQSASMYVNIISNSNSKETSQLR